MLGSPCIDAGNPASPLDPDGTRADIGGLPFEGGWMPGPAPYCPPFRRVTSQCLATISATGEASVSGASTLVLQAVNVPERRFGQFFIGTEAQFTPYAFAASSGWLPVRERNDPPPFGPVFRAQRHRSVRRHLGPIDLSGDDCAAWRAAWRQAFWSVCVSSAADRDRAHRRHRDSDRSLIGRPPSL